MNKDRQNEYQLQPFGKAPGNQNIVPEGFNPPGLPPIVQNVRAENFTVGSGSSASILANEVIVEDIDYQHRRLQDHMNEVIQKDLAVFVETEAYPVAKACLDRHHHVTITGRPGSGKTATAYQLMRDHKEDGFDVFIVDEPCELKHSRDPKRKTIILVDNMFGRDSFQEDSFLKWQNSLENEICPLLGYGGERKLNLR